MSPSRNLMTLAVMGLLASISLTIGSMSPFLSEASPTAPAGISFYPSGVSPDYLELNYPILCGSKGTLAFAVKTQAATTWYGVAIEVPREFGGLADGVTVNVKSTITNNYTYIKVIDEARYHPYNMSAPFWVEVSNPSGFSGLRYIFIEGLVAPSLASRYIFSCYYSFTQPTPAHPTAFDYSSLLPIKASNKPPTYYALTVPVSMSLDSASITGRIVDNVTTAFGLKRPITTRGVVTASQDGTVMARALVDRITSDFTLTGLAPGTYTVTASAGYWNVTNSAYPPRELYTFILASGQTQTIDLILYRSGNLSGTINWETAPTLGLPFRVEAYDSVGMLRGVYSGVSAGSSLDYWRIREGPDGLSGFSDGDYTVKVWAYGYLQETAPTIRVIQGMASSVSISMVKGGVISGSINYSNAPAEGNSILVEAYNGTGVLKGVYIGTTSGESSDTFRIRGFSETRGETDLPGGQALASHSGRGYKDSGLLDGLYTLKAWVVGYLTPPSSINVTISNRGTATITIPLIKGGEISGTVLSKTSAGADHAFAYPGTQLRIHFYDSTGRSVGYTSLTQMATATNATYGPFRGFAWKSLGLGYIRMGYHDTALANETYTIKACTKGYIQTTHPTINITGSGSHHVNFAIIKGGWVQGTLSFKSAIYYASVRTVVSLEVYDSEGALRGVSLYEMTAFNSLLTYRIYGFHSYTHSNGTSMMDYGLPDGAYNITAVARSINVTGAPANISPAFICFTSPTTNSFSITQGGSVALDFSIYQDGLIYGTIRGYTATAGAPIPLSWVSVNDSTGAISTSTLDGDYYLGLPEGSQSVTMSCIGYHNYTAPMPITSGSYSTFSVALAPSKPYLIVRLSVTPNPLDEAAGQLSATCSAHLAPSDGRIPTMVTYSWECSGGSFNSTTGATVTWTSPTVWETTTYKITCSISALGYDSGSDTETLFVYPIPEFPLGATLTLITALGLALYLSRLFKKPPAV